MTSTRTLAFGLALLLASVAAVQAEGTFFKPAKQVLPPATTKTAAPATEDTDKATSPSFPDVLTGSPSVVDTATLVVDGHRVLLMGIDGLTGVYASGLQTFIASYGNSVTCTLIAQGPYYHCVTASQNVDVAEAALLNGAAKTNDSATPSQKAKEAQSRSAGRGVWASTGQ